MLAWRSCEVLPAAGAGSSCHLEGASAGAPAVPTSSSVLPSPPRHAFPFSAWRCRLGGVRPWSRTCLGPVLNSLSCPPPSFTSAFFSPLYLKRRWIFGTVEMKQQNNSSKLSIGLEAPSIPGACKCDLSVNSTHGER